MPKCPSSKLPSLRKWIELVKGAKNLKPFYSNLIQLCDMCLSYDLSDHRKDYGYFS